MSELPDLPDLAEYGDLESLLRDEDDFPIDFDDNAPQKDPADSQDNEENENIPDIPEEDKDKE